MATEEYKCAVVEDVCLVTEVVKIMDEAVMALSVVHVTDYVLFDGAPTLESTVVVTESVVAGSYANLAATAWVVEQLGFGLTRTLDEHIHAFDSYAAGMSDVVEEQVFVASEALSATSLVLSDKSVVNDTVLVGVSVAAQITENVAVYGGVVADNEVLCTSNAVVVDALELAVTTSLADAVAASDAAELALAIDGVLSNPVYASDYIKAVQQFSVIENLVLSAEVEAVSSFVLTDSARASEHLALGTAITQQMTERVSASEYLVDGDANVAEDWLTVVDIQQSTVRAQGQLRSEAIAQDQPVGEVDRGYSVHDQLAASEFLHIEISTPLEVLVIANDHTALGFEAVAPETVGDTYASVEMTGQGVVRAQCLEVLQATATAEFLVGTTNGVYEMLAAEYITVYDRVEVVEALDSFAWVLNSQSLAHSYYDGFVDFNSAVQLGNRTFMLSPSGLYELGGDSDDGKIIEAEVVTGQKDFGTIDRKRVEQFDLGYTAAGDLQAVVSCEGFEPSEPQTLEAREMRTAHTSRIRVGKGMVGRYWKLELKNREGADFELFSLQTKVALSTRRMR